MPERAGSALAGRAAVLRGPGDVRLEERAHGAVQPSGWAVVQVEASAVCGTDVEIYRGGVPVEPGRVMGHEGAGTLVAVPRGHPDLEAGMRVLVNPVVFCGRCVECANGRFNLCPEGGLLGRDLDGVFADRVVVPAGNCHLLPDGLRLEEAPAIQLLSTVAHAHERVSVAPGRIAAVIGLGFTGQLHAQLLRLRGARVVGITRTASKRELAGRLACEWTAAPDETEALLRELDPRGFVDLVVECSGALEALALAMRIVRPGGTVLCYGTMTESAGSLPFYAVYFKELSIVGTRAARPPDVEVAIDLVARGAVELAPLISDQLPLERVAEALERSREGALKVVLAH